MVFKLVLEHVWPMDITSAELDRIRHATFKTHIIYLDPVYMEWGTPA